MFGFGRGESTSTISRKRDYMQDAQKTWEFLTIYDLSTVKTPGELAAMIQARSSTTEEQATREVEAWMRDKYGIPA